MRAGVISDMIRDQFQHLKRNGHTPTVLRLGQAEDEKMLEHFKKIDVNGRMAHATTLHGFAYSGLSIHVTDKPTGVQVS